MTNSVGTKVALTAMIATIHHMPFAWDFMMIDPHCEDWLRWQSQTSGRQHLLGRAFGGTQLEGEDCLGLWDQASQRTTLTTVGVSEEDASDAFNSKGAW